MTPEELSQLIASELAAAQAAGEFSVEGELPEVKVERPRSRDHGDWATNVAMQLAKRAGMKPHDLAQLLANRLAAAPGDYPWSSHAHYAGLCNSASLVPPPAYWALGNTPFAREAAYAEMVRAGISLAQHEALTRAVLGGWVLGDEAFVAQLQQGLPRRLTRARPGRPPKAG